MSNSSLAWARCGNVTGTVRHDRLMEIVERNDETVVIRVTRGEVSILNNALNEILNCPESIEEWDFHTRVGVTRDEAEKLLEALHELLRAPRDAPS